VRSQPDALAVVDYHGSLSYGELGRLAARVAHRLRALGCQPQERVAISIPQSCFQVAAVLGCLLAEAVYVAVDLNQPLDRRAAMMESARAHFVMVASDSGLPEIEGGATICVDELDSETEAEFIFAADSRNPAYVIYTSGSTGIPKGVVISHRAALNTIADINRRFNVGPADRVLGLSQLGFDLSVYDIFGVLGQGGAIVYSNPELRANPCHWFELMSAHAVSLWNSVPALMQMLVDFLESEGGLDLPHLRLAMLSGDRIPLHLPERLRTLLPQVQIVSLGGATEAAIWSIFHPYAGLRSDWTSIPYGRPLANQGFCTLDKRLRDCPEWVPGDLYIYGEGLALKYLGDTELTADRFIRHPQDSTRLYKTGDLGRYIPGGEIEFLGRDDKQVKIRGHRIELGEIESAIQHHPSVANSCVIHEAKGNAVSLHAFAQPSPATEAQIAERHEGFATCARGLQQAVIENLDALSSLRSEEIAHALQAMDRASCYAMLRALQGLGVLAAGKPCSLADITGTKKIDRQFHWLVKRWLVKLQESGCLLEATSGVYLSSIQTEAAEEQSLWQETRESWAAHFNATAFVDYVENHAKVLPELLSGMQNAAFLLFPKDRDDAALSSHADALYAENRLMQFLNVGIATLAARIVATEPDRTWKILEVGAGTGATTAVVLKALAGRNIDYHFTDVTPYFFSEVKHRYDDWPQVHFSLYDMDKDFRKQGLLPNSFDIVIAGGGVLIGSCDIPRALEQAETLARPGGWLILSEPSREHHWLLISQAFMMPEPQDALRQETSCLDREKWIRLVAQRGGGTAYSMPEPGHPLEVFGNHLFATRVKTDRAAIAQEALIAFLKKKLPAYMIPSSIQIMDSLPLTTNGKVDVKCLRAWIGCADTELLNEQSAPKDALEKQLAALWSEVLGLTSISRTQNFNELGADSLTMAQMAGRLRDTLSNNGYGVLSFDVLLQEILNDSTIAGLASFLRSQANATQDAAKISNATAAKHFDNIGAYTFFSETESGPLRVLFPAGAGTMDCLRPLIRLLVKQDLGPVLGVSLADTQRYLSIAPEILIEEVAGDYVAHFLKMGHKKVQIIGYCLGGMTSIEAARRLKESGVDVIDLVLVDAHRVPFAVEDDLLIEIFYLPNLFVSLERIGYKRLDDQAMMGWFLQTLAANDNTIPSQSPLTIGGSPQLDAIGSVFRDLSRFSQEERFDTYVAAMPEIHGRRMPKEMVLRMFKSYAQSFKAARFTPSPYLGDIRYLRALDSSGLVPGMNDEIIDFWRNICLGDMSISDIGGNHYTCIEPPHVKRVADLIGQPLAVR